MTINLLKRKEIRKRLRLGLRWENYCDESILGMLDKEIDRLFLLNNMDVFCRQLWKKVSGVGYKKL